ncbi:MAG: AAA family ATPase [Candidatus Limimorpha sp.]
MNTIGFNNFRRFAKFPEMDLGDITLLVGGNNSGKSTLVKALLLCVDNLKLMSSSTNAPKFRFDANEWHDVKIKTFSRAIHNKPVPVIDQGSDEEKTELPSEMRFVFTIGSFRFVFDVYGERDGDEVTGEVSFISIEDRGNMVKYDISFKSHIMCYSVLGSTSERETLIKRLYRDYKSAKEELEKLSDEGSDIVAISSQSEKVASLEKRIEEFINPDDNELPEDFDYEQALRQQFRNFHAHEYTTTSWDYLPLEFYYNQLNGNLLVDLIGNFIQFAKNPGAAAPKDIEDPNEYGVAMEKDMYIQAARKDLLQEEDKIRKSQEDLKALLNSFKIEYITAHAANQNTIYNTADRNDYIAQTVHGFVRAKIARGQKEYIFVTDWMRKFGVGHDFDVISIDGEAYRVKIKDEDNSTVNLADKGMGSIQLMILLLRLATILREYEPQNMVALEDNDKLRYPTIVIEEPEQNLHPKVQSLLADLFLYLNREYFCRFLIETHSEYIIRKTQAIVAEQDYKNEDELNEHNPFMVYFFEPNASDRPRRMDYAVSGAFKEKFGEGFFDEASKWDMTIIRKEFELKKKAKK